MELTIQLASPEEAMELFGLGDRNLKLLREALPVQVTARGGVLRLEGDREPVEQAAAIMNDMIELVRDGLKVAPDYLEKQLEELRPAPSKGNGGAVAGEDRLSRALQSDEILSGRKDASATTPSDAAGAEGEPRARIARSPGQEKYVRAIHENDVVFCTGPAGTGKTFLAVRVAIDFLREGQIRKIILCRPAVEAGEKLGFLPGDFQAKINPYLRPLYDALNEILDYEQVKRYMEREIIEIIPLAYMRGRTLNNAFIILDEGQNTTASQMKMFLTRMGMHSKIVANGDTTQVDLPEGQLSGLIHVNRILRNVRGIAWVEMQRQDIVRHPLVKRIVDAYEKLSAGRRS